MCSRAISAGTPDTALGTLGTQPCFPPAAEGSPSEQRTEQGAFPWGSRRKDCSTQKPAGSPWQLALHGHTSEKPGLSRASLCWLAAQKPPAAIQTQTGQHAPHFSGLSGISETHGDSTHILSESHNMRDERKARSP